MAGPPTGSRGEQFLRIGCAPRKKIGDEQSAIAPAPGETDAAADGRIVVKRIGRRRVEHDEGAESFAARPVPFQTIAIGASCCHSTQFYPEMLFPSIGEVEHVDEQYYI